MARKVIWTEIAWRDLESVAEYIARDSVHYAGVFVREIRAASRTLGVYSERGRIVPELSDNSIRELLVGNYRLIYGVEADKVYILALLHGARDLEELWKKRK
jgi:toxin ParE1/3/4